MNNNPIYTANTTTWRKGDLVIHDADAKRASMLMRVTGYDRATGLIRTRYVLATGVNAPLRGVWRNEPRYLHDPRRFGIALPANSEAAR